MSSFFARIHVGSASANCFLFHSTPSPLSPLSFVTRAAPANLSLYLAVPFTHNPLPSSTHDSSSVSFATTSINIILIYFFVVPILYFLSFYLSFEFYLHFFFVFPFLFFLFFLFFLVQFDLDARISIRRAFLNTLNYLLFTRTNTNIRTYLTYITMINTGSYI